MYRLLLRPAFVCNLYNDNRVYWVDVIASDIEQLSRFASGGYCDDSTIVYLQHPCVILTALEVLGYKVVASSSTSVKQDYNEYMWTMRKDFSEPEPEPVIKTELKDNEV